MKPRMLGQPTPQSFKAIALVTPGGDLAYCIDFHKQSYWHLHLCATLRDWLDLPEPPHFLLPYCTATVDRWVDPDSGQIHTIAEAAPLILRYRALLNQLFDLGDQPWQPTTPAIELRDPDLMQTYYQQFPELWHNHNLVIRLKSTRIEPAAIAPVSSPQPPACTGQSSINRSNSYVLRLFVSSHNANTQRTLHILHQTLEQAVGLPYTLKVIDISKYPEQAELDQVTATPTLMRVSPLPVRRIVGDLEDSSRILSLFGLSSQ